jgi:hypothetical protein
VRDDNRPVSRLTFPRLSPGKIAHDLAQQIWLRSGKIINLEDREMPNGTALAAILRY